VGAALLVAACSSSSSGSPAATTPTGPPASSSTPATTGAAVSVATSSVGQILVDSSGRTIYAFAIDKPNVSNCSGGCLQAWPVVAAANTTAGSGVTAKLGMITRSDGAAQLTVNSYPVYTFAGDKSPGQVNGQGLDSDGGLWWVIAPDGNWIKASGGSSASSGNNAGGPYGY
jgi:predicted lipoprotein with Yx(FWY)xxD motif